MCASLQTVDSKQSTLGQFSMSEKALFGFFWYIDFGIGRDNRRGDNHAYKSKGN